MTPQDDLLVIRAHGIVDIYLAGSVTGLKLDRLTPARGGSGAHLRAITTLMRRDGPAEQDREIAAVSGTFDPLDTLADSLASRLAVPLDTWTGPSD